MYFFQVMFNTLHFYAAYSPYKFAINCVFSPQNVLSLTFFRLLETGRWLSESLLEEANYQNPTPWNVDEKLCVCPDAANAATVQSLPLCSVNEEQTCTKSKSHKGKKLNTETRPKRDTGGHINLDIEKRVHRLKEFILEQHTIHRKKVRQLIYMAVVR